MSKRRPADNEYVRKRCIDCRKLTRVSGFDLRIEPPRCGDCRYVWAEAALHASLEEQRRIADAAAQVARTERRKVAKYYERTADMPQMWLDSPRRGSTYSDLRVETTSKPRRSTLHRVAIDPECDEVEECDFDIYN